MLKYFYNKGSNNDVIAHQSKGTPNFCILLNMSHTS